MARGVKALKARTPPDTTFLCLSNANSVYIGTILKVPYTNLHGAMPGAKAPRFYRREGSQTSLTRSSPTLPRGKMMDSSKYGGKSTLLDLSIRAPLVVLRTCAKVRRLIHLFLTRCSCGCRRLGDELEAYLARKGGIDSYDKLVYIGDGSNDFCPILRMRK